MKDLIQAKGTAALGTRLRRLSERLDRDVREIYLAQGILFETSWFPVITALNERGPLSVGDLAEITGVSQPAISQIRKRVEAQGLVRSRAATIDQRRHELALTAAGMRLIETLGPLWEAIAKASAELCRDTAPNLLAELEALERALDTASMSKRVAAIRGQKTKSAKSLRKAI